MASSELCHEMESRVRSGVAVDPGNRGMRGLLFSNVEGGEKDELFVSACDSVEGRNMIEL